MTDKPSIDYTNKDFASLRKAMLDLALYRLPEWTDRSASDLGTLLVDLFAYTGDVCLHYQDRIAAESFLHTARERRSVLHLLRLIGYQLSPPVAASAELVLSFTPPGPGDPTQVTIPRGARFASDSAYGTPRPFEYLGAPLTIDLTSDQVIASDGLLVYAGLPVRQSQLVPTEIIGSSTGEPNQRFALSQSPVLLDTLEVEVDEGAGWVRWDRRDSLLYNVGPDQQIAFSGPLARDYTTQSDEHDQTEVLTGDDLYGRIPPVGLNNVRASYRVGGGTAGNVPAGAITEIVTVIPLLASVTNPLPAAGGAEHESIEHGVRFGPASFRSGMRAVTLSDYVSLAHQAGGVAKVRARSQGWNSIELYVAPEGETCRPVPEDLRRRLLAWFEDKRMVGTFLEIKDAHCVLIDVALVVVLDERYRAEAVRQSVEQAVQGLLDYAQIDFGQGIYLSDIYAAVEATPGVAGVKVTEFRRRDSETSAIETQLAASNLPPIDELPEFLQNALRLEVSSEGRIEVGPFEIATLGDLDLELQGGGG